MGDGSSIHRSASYTIVVKTGGHMAMGQNKKPCFSHQNLSLAVAPMYPLLSFNGVKSCYPHLCRAEIPMGFSDEIPKDGTQKSPWFLW
jgi:hypothetical protein